MSSLHVCVECGNLCPTRRTACPGCSVSRRRRELKKKAVTYLGGQCEICHYSRCARSLTFHHRDPSLKEFTISNYGRSWARLQAELDKCALLCANCHGEVHDGLVTLGK